MDNFINMLSTVGFPIASCIAIAFFANSFINKYVEDVKNMVDCINKNTEVIEALTEKLKEE